MLFRHVYLTPYICFFLAELFCQAKAWVALFIAILKAVEPAGN